jgi:hypothetical protein
MNRMKKSDRQQAQVISAFNEGFQEGFQIGLLIRGRVDRPTGTSDPPFGDFDLSIGHSDRAIGTFDSGITWDTNWIHWAAAGQIGAPSMKIIMCRMTRTMSCRRLAEEEVPSPTGPRRNALAETSV